MNKWINYALICIVSSPWLAHAEQEIYSKKMEGIFSSYNKLEPSGCTTQLTLIPNWHMIRINYVGGCRKPEESTTAIVQSLHDIVAYYQLTDSLKTMRQMEVNIVWKVSHWPLIQHLNNSPDWPKNASSLFTKKPGDPKIKQHIEYIRSKLLMPDVYGPFLSFMNTHGCHPTLRQHYADPLYSRKSLINKQQLVQWGAYHPEHVYKMVFPDIIGYVGFEFSCSLSATSPSTTPSTTHQNK